MFGLNLNDIGAQVVQWVSPGLVVLMPAVAVATRQIVRFVRRRFWTSLDGNAVQTLTACCSVVAVTIVASTNNVFADGTDYREITGLLLLAGVNTLSAIGVNEALTDRGGSEGEDGSEDTE